MEAFRDIQAASPVVRVPGRTQEELDQPVAEPIAGPDAQPRSDSESSRAPSVLMPSVPKWSSPAFVDSGETVDTPRNSGVRQNFTSFRERKARSDELEEICRIRSLLVSVSAVDECMDYHCCYCGADYQGICPDLAEYQHYSEKHPCRICGENAI